MNEQFVWPSDVARAENDELNRVCEYAEHLHDELQAARQAPASGEVEPVCLVRKNDSGQVYLCNPDGTAFQPYNYIGVDFYTHPPAKVPDGITGEMLNKVWKAGFDAENIDDREYCQELIILRNAVEDATPTPAATAETEWVKAKTATEKVIVTVCYQEGCSDLEPLYLPEGMSDDDIEENIYEELYSEIHGNPGFRSYSWKRIPTPPQEQ